MKQLLFNSAAHLSKCLLVCVCLIAAGINSMARSNSPGVGVYASTLDDPTEKAIYCNENRTLYFVYDTYTYTVGDMYYADDTNPYSITAVYTGFKDMMYSAKAYKATDGEHKVLDVNGDEVQLAENASYSNHPWDYYARYIKTVDFQNSFKNFRNESRECWFYGFSSLEEVKNASTNFDLSEVMYMADAFNGCSALTTLDVSGWNISNVSQMHHTFMNCSGLTTLDVSNWNTSSMQYLSGTFSGCSGLSSLDVSRWDVSQVYELTSTFRGCSGLSSLDVSSWNVSRVRTLSETFANCTSLTDLDVSNWNTKSVTDMLSTFANCTSLTDLDVSNWNTAKVTYMADAFNGCSALTTLDVSRWNVAQVTNMSATFIGCSGLSSLDVSNWNVSNVTDMDHTFCDCSGLSSLDVSNWDVSNVTDMDNTFWGCSGLSSLNVNSWNTANVTDMGGTFYGCSNLTALNVSNWDTRKVKKFFDQSSGFVGGCSGLTSITFGANFSMDKVTSESYKKKMFSGCTNLRYIDFYASNDANAITTVNRRSSSGNNTMFAGTPATTVIYLPHGAEKLTSGKQNVVYTNEETLKCEDYYSEDKVDIELPRDFQAKKAQYSRPTMTRKFGTCILPYAFHSNSDIQAYTLNEEHRETMYFVETDIVPAHTPFLFQKLGTAAFIENEGTTDSYDITVKATKDTKVEGPYLLEDYYTIDATTGSTPDATGLKWSTRGYYINETVSQENGWFYIAQDKFWEMQSNITMYPHRAMFGGSLYYTTGSGAPSFNIVIAGHNGNTTRIDASDIDREDGEATYYDAQGRRIPELRQGLNIVRTSDGSVRKVMVK